MQNIIKFTGLHRLFGYLPWGTRVQQYDSGQSEPGVWEWVSQPGSSGTGYPHSRFRSASRLLSPQRLNTQCLSPARTPPGAPCWGCASGPCPAPPDLSLSVCTCCHLKMFHYCEKKIVCARSFIFYIVSFVMMTVTRKTLLSKVIWNKRLISAGGRDYFQTCIQVRR